MTKWVALALGALLALVGAVCIGLGYDVIQTERGGVLVIAGAVALTGGVLTFALFAVLGELRALLAVRSMQPVEGEAGLSEPALTEAVAPSASASPEPVLAPPTPVKLPEPPPSSPVFHEPPASEPSVPAAEGKPASPELKVWERPSPFRSSSFGAPRSPTPLAVFAGGAAAGAVVAAATRSEPVEVVPETAVAEPVPEPVVEEVDDQVERAIALALADESPAESPAELSAPVESAPVESPDAEVSAKHSEDHAEESPEAPPRQPRSLREALGLQELPPEETPPPEKQDEKPAQDAAKPALTPLIDVEASPSVAAGYAWLERALATEDGRKSRALEWLRARQRAGAVDDSPRTEGAKTEQESAPAHEPDRAPASEGAPKAEPEILQVREPEAVEVLASAPDHGHEREPEQAASEEPQTQIEPEGAPSAPIEAVYEPEPEVSPELEEQPHEPASEPEPQQEAAPAPTIVGRYSSGGSDFTLYSDGSIDAQTDQGLFHFASMADLRAHIEAQNAQG